MRVRTSSVRDENGVSVQSGAGYDTVCTVRTCYSSACACADSCAELSRRVTYASILESEIGADDFLAGLEQELQEERQAESAEESDDDEGRPNLQSIPEEQPADLEATMQKGVCT